MLICSPYAHTQVIYRIANSAFSDLRLYSVRKYLTEVNEIYSEGTKRQLMCQRICIKISFRENKKFMVKNN